MKIVHLYKDYHPPTRGGIEQLVESMATRQVRAGHEVTVLTSAHGDRRDRDEIIDGVRVLRMAEWARFASAPLCPGMPLALSRLRADVFHMQFPSPPGEVSWLTVRPRGALVVSYQSDIIRQKALLPVYGPVVRAILARAQVILASADQNIERSAFLRPHRDKCMVVPLGVDLARFAGLDRRKDAAAALRARYGGPLVLFVGRLRAYKGLHVLLEAMAHVHGRLVIVGDGPEREALHALHARLGLGERVHFGGDVTDDGLLAHLAAADVGVLPSILPSEAYGMAMVEMLACGVPVVCTELGTGTSYVNQHDVTGLVVPPNDSQALAAALNRLLPDNTLRARMGAAGRERAHSHLSVEAMMRGVERAYETALDRERRRA